MFLMRSMGMEWWDRVLSPMRRVWISLATRIGVRKTGLRRLRQEVRTCEYEDVHVMWEMLRKTSEPEKKKKGRHVWHVFRWAPINFCPRGF